MYDRSVRQLSMVPGMYFLLWLRKSCTSTALPRFSCGRSLALLLYCWLVSCFFLFFSIRIMLAWGVSVIFWGIMDLVSLPRSRWAGELLMSAVGVFLYSNSARYGSSARLINFLASLTAASAFPFDWWWYGELVLCWNSQLWLNLWNSVAANCGPLSECTRAGIPCLANVFLQASTTFSVSVDVSSSISKKSDK